MAGGRQGASEFDPGRLREQRRSAALSQADLAAAAGVHERVVGFWETGVRVPQVDAVAALARALGVPPVELLKPGERITVRLLRVRAGLNQRQAASSAGLLPHRYGQLERGEVADPAGDLDAIARAFDVAVGEVRAAYAISRADHLGSRRDDAGRTRSTRGED